MDHIWNDFRMDIGPPGTGGSFEMYIFFRIPCDDYVQLRERQYRAKSLHLHGEPETSRDFGTPWRHHFPVALPNELQVLILGFVFHSEASMRSAVRQEYEEAWAAVWEAEEPTGLFLEY